MGGRRLALSVDCFMFSLFVNVDGRIVPLGPFMGQGLSVFNSLSSFVIVVCLLGSGPLSLYMIRAGI